jgi:hypothetical protein
VLCALAAIVARGGGGLAQDGASDGEAPLERGTNRPGGDYLKLELSDPDPQLCRAACLQNLPCAAWTFVPADLPGGRATCWLKNTAPAPVPDDCCISGLGRPR